MKRTKLIKQITAKEAILIRHGSNHDIYAAENGNIDTIFLSLV